MTYAKWSEIALQYFGVLLTGAAGSFFGAFLKKSGENLAIHRDLGKLIEQVSAVTVTTQRIEAKTTRSLRIHERQIDILIKLYRHLFVAQSFFQNMTRGSRFQGEIEPEQYGPKVTESLRNAYDELLNGRLLLSPQIVAMCEEFLRKISAGEIDFACARDTMNPNPAQRGAAWREAADAAFKTAPEILRQIEDAARLLIDGESQ